jgi:hypothetical protein
MALSPKLENYVFCISLRLRAIASWTERRREMWHADVYCIFRTAPMARSLKVCFFSLERVDMTSTYLPVVTSGLG